MYARALRQKSNQSKKGRGTAIRFRVPSSPKRTAAACTVMPFQQCVLFSLSRKSNYTITARAGLPSASVFRALSELLDVYVYYIV